MLEALGVWRACRIALRRWWFRLGMLLTLAALFYLQYHLMAWNLAPAVREAPFIWDAPKTATDAGCRNTQQSSDIIADERGYVCARTDVDTRGCCLPRGTPAPSIPGNTRNGSTVGPYSCRGCALHGCCSVFEFCVSCCLQPRMRPLQQQIIDSARGLLLLAVRDPFELCLAKCRTDALSVVHENIYKDSKYRFCFSPNGPKERKRLP